MLWNEDNVVLKDHYSIMARLNIEKQLPKSKTITFRKLRYIEPNDFKRDIINSSLLSNCALSLNVMVNNYNKSLSVILDSHAPIVHKTLLSEKMHFGMITHYWLQRASDDS